MPERDDLKRQLIAIAAALSMSEHALLALADVDEWQPAPPDADADVVEIAENALAITDPRARRLLLRLSRRLAARGTR